MVKFMNKDLNFVMNIVVDSVFIIFMVIVV